MKKQEKKRPWNWQDKGEVVRPETNYAFRDELRIEKMNKRLRDDEIRKSRQCKLS